MGVAGGAIGRAVLQAYREAAAGRAGAAAAKGARRRMSIEEAKQVLEVDSATGAPQIEERHDVLRKLNEPNQEDSPGSPYLQARISAARTVLLEEIQKGNPKEKTPPNVE